MNGLYCEICGCIHLSILDYCDKEPKPMIFKDTKSLLTRLNRILEVRSLTTHQFLKAVIAQEDQDTIELIWGLALAGSQPWIDAWMET